MIRWLELRRMRRAYYQLPERDRAIFGSVRFEDLDYVQAAQRHCCSVEDVERTIARVLVALDRVATGRRE
jgi:DNA-directed RNA polymerase specialized sigma24 family protein